MRDWLTRLLGPRSPIICHLKAGDPDGTVQLEYEGLTTRGANAANLGPRAGEDEMRCSSSINEAGKNG